jgi:hypothetical protein
MLCVLPCLVLFVFSSLLIYISPCLVLSCLFSPPDQRLHLALQELYRGPGSELHQGPALLPLQQRYPKGTVQYLNSSAVQRLSDNQEHF